MTRRPEMEYYSDLDQYVAGEDSQDDESSDDDTVGSLELGNVVGSQPTGPLTLHASSARNAGAAAATQQAAQRGPPAIPTSWPISTKGRQRQEGAQPLILFDLNGVLMQHRFDGTRHNHDLRPGVHHLLRLLSHFRLGVYTSSTRGTVQRALTKLAGNLHNALQQAQRAPGFPQALPDQLFHVVMCREHCLPADKALIAERGGKPWDTVKPLQRYFADLSRVLLVDDSPHKALPQEAANMLVTPCWHGPGTPQGKGDAVLPALVDALLRCARAGLGDVRLATAGITHQLAALAGTPPPVPLASPQSAASLAPGQLAGEVLEPVEQAIPAGSAAAGGAARPTGEEGGRKAKKRAREAAQGGAGASAIGVDAELAAAMRVLYIDSVRVADESWYCRSTDVIRLVELQLPWVGPVLETENRGTKLAFSIPFLKAAAKAGVIEYSGCRLGRNGQWVRLPPGTAVPPAPCMEELAQYAASVACQLPKPSPKQKKLSKKQRKQLQGGQPAVEEVVSGAQQSGAQRAAGQLAQGAELEAMRRDVLVYCLSQLQERGGTLGKEIALYLASKLEGGDKSEPRQPGRVAAWIREAEEACLKAGTVVKLGLGAERVRAKLAWHALAPTAPLPSPGEVDAAFKTVAATLRGTRSSAPTQQVEPAAAASASAVAQSADALGKAQTVVLAAAAGSAAPAPAAHTQVVDGARQASGSGAGSNAATAEGVPAAAPSPLLLAVFEDRGPSRAPPPNCSAQQAQLGTVQQAPGPAEPGQQAQQGKARADAGEEEATKGKVSNTERKRQLLAEEAQKLGMSGPGKGLTKKELASFRRSIRVEKKRRSKQDRGQEEGIEGWEEKEEQRAVLAAHTAPAEQSPTTALHGGHFLRSCGSVSPVEPAAHAAPAAQQTAHPQQGQPSPAKRARHDQPLGNVSAQLASAPVEPAIPAQHAQHGASPQQAGQAQQVFSALHYEVMRFAQRATPTPQEVADVRQAVEGIAAAAQGLWSQASTVLFGSQATGLALPGSDLDIVILNVGPHIERAGTGFSQGQRKQLGGLLEDLLDALLGVGLIHGKAQLIEARVPIIKCCLAVGPGLMADISLGAANGAAAVDYVRRQVVSVPPLRPLCLVVKAFLRERGVNEVFTGGLSSYAVVNMVMAHLQQEGYTPAPLHPAAAPAAPGALPETFAFLADLAASAAHHHYQPPQQGAPADLGVLLYGFFHLFGCRFGYTREAVSIRLGGVCTKIKAWRQGRRPWLLAVEDPQEPGKDIASGSFNVKDVKGMFAAAAELLAEVCEDAAANAEVWPARTPQQQARPQRGALAGVVNIEAAVGRGPDGIKARRTLEERAAAKSAVVKQQRTRQGVPVGGAKAPRLAAGRGGRRGEGSGRHQQPQQQEAHGGAASGGKFRGSKRTRLIEAQWGDKQGQFRGDDDDDDTDWSLRKQKKGRKSQTSIPASKRGKQGKRGGRGWVTDSGAGAPSSSKRKRQRKYQE